jgi:hypothetical protein
MHNLLQSTSSAAAPFPHVEGPYRADPASILQPLAFRKGEQKANRETVLLEPLATS